MKKAFFLAILMLCYPAFVQANPAVGELREAIAQRIFRMAEASLEAQNRAERAILESIGHSMPGWQGATTVSVSNTTWHELVDPAVSKVLSLQAQQGVRKSYQTLHGKILADMRRNWLQRTYNRVFQGKTYKRVAESMEQRGGNNLERLYREAIQPFQTADDFLRYVEDAQLVQKGIIKRSQLEMFQKLKLLDEAKAITQGLAPQAAFRELRTLRQSQIREEFFSLLKKSDRQIYDVLDDFVLLYRNFSEQNQVFMSYAEARFALKFQYRFYNLWRNSRWAQNPALKRKWFRFWKRWQEVVKVPKHLPNEEKALAEFFKDFHDIVFQISEPGPAIVLGKSRRVLTRPSRFIENAIHHQAKAMSAELDLFRGMETLSPEVEAYMHRKAAHDVMILEMEKVLETEGIEGVLKMLSQTEKSVPDAIAEILGRTRGGYDPRPLQLAYAKAPYLSPFPGKFKERNILGWTLKDPYLFEFRFTENGVIPYLNLRQRGHYFRSWVFNHMVAGVFAYVIFRDEGAHPSERPPWEEPGNGMPGTLPPGYNPEDPVYGGKYVPRNPEDLADSQYRLIIESLERDIQALVQERNKKLEDQNVATPEENLKIEQRLQEIDQEIRKKQRTIAKILEEAEFKNEEE